MPTRAFPIVATSPSRPWHFRGIAWKVQKTAIFSTEVQRSQSDLESRRAYVTRPRWEFTLRWNNLRDTMDEARNAARTGRKVELQKIISFFLEGHGDYLPFLFKDPTDHVVVAQTIATAPGGDTDFPLVRAFGSGGFVEPVGALDTTATNVIRLGATPTTAYTANTPYDGWIRFDTAPSNGTVISGDYSYLFKLRFKEAKAAFHTFAKNFWEFQKCEMVSARP